MSSSETKETAYYRQVAKDPATYIDGALVYSWFDIPDVTSKSCLHVSMLTFSSDVRQGVIAECSKFMKTSGQESKKFILWADAMPAAGSCLQLQGKRRTNGVRLTLRNAWQGKWGVDSGLGFHGMVVTKTGPSTWRIQCSHGRKERDFTNLVFDLSIHENCPGKP